MCRSAAVVGGWATPQQGVLDLQLDKPVPLRGVERPRFDRSTV
jgi:hypothetical protein